MRVARVFIMAALVSVGILGSNLPALDGSGGPDDAGYTWFDSDSGLTDLSVPQMQSPTALFVMDDTIVSIPLPFSFDWYGADTDTAYVSDDGWIGFSADFYPRVMKACPGMSWRLCSRPRG